MAHGLFVVSVRQFQLESFEYLFAFMQHTYWRVYYFDLNANSWKVICFLDFIASLSYRTICTWIPRSIFLDMSHFMKEEIFCRLCYAKYFALCSLKSDEWLSVTNGKIAENQNKHEIETSMNNIWFSNNRSLDSIISSKINRLFWFWFTS